MNNLDKLQIAVLCGVLLTFTACSSLSKNDVNALSSSSSNSAATAPIFTASNDPRADLIKSIRKNLEAKSYRMRNMITSSNGYNSRKTGEFVAPDRMHIITETDMPGSATVQREIIYIGKESYVRAGDSAWQKSEFGMGDVIAQMRDPKLIEEITQNAEVKYLGNDTLNGAPMLIYQYKMKDVLGTGINSVSKVWIGATDNQQYQRESESDSESETTGKMNHTKSTSTFYDYNTDIKIEPPM